MILVCFLIIIILLVFLCINRQYYIKNRVKNSLNTELYNPTLEELQTEKIIWSYWNSKERPLSVNLAIHTWKKHNPDFLICVLSENTVSDYLDLNTFPKKYSKLNHQHKADIIRLALLEKYGGYWLDSTLYLNQPLSILWEPKDYEIGGYYADFFTKDKKNPVLENWFLSAPKNSKLVKEWKDEFYKGIDYDNPSDYIKELEKEVDLQNIKDKTYLMMHCAFLKIIKDRKDQTNQNYRLKVLPAGAKGGPFEYLIKFKFNDLLYVIYILTSKGEDVLPVIKLRGGERKIIEWCWFMLLKNSIIDKLVK